MTPNVAASVRNVLDASGAPLGAVVGVTVHDQTHIAADGARDLAGTAVVADTVFDLASVSKVAATTTTLHRLAKLGQLRFDDPVDRFLPTSPCTPQTTVRDLLTHRAGLWEWQPLYFTEDPDRTVDALPLRYPAGSERHYSDLGFILLGRIVAAATSMTLDAAVHELVHAPLQMHATRYAPASGAVASSSLGDQAEQRMVRTGEPYPVLFDAPADFSWRTTEVSGQPNDGNCFHAFGGVSGHAGLFSTAADLLRLGASLARADIDDDFWGADASAEVLRDGPDAGQALGWRSIPVSVRGEPRRLLWHGGYTGCALGFVPGEDLAAVLLSNRLFADTITPVPELWTRALAPIDELDLLSTPER